LKEFKQIREEISQGKYVHLPGEDNSCNISLSFICEDNDVKVVLKNGKETQFKIKC